MILESEQCLWQESEVEFFRADSQAEDKHRRVEIGSRWGNSTRQSSLGKVSSITSYIITGLNEIKEEAI